MRTSAKLINACVDSVTIAFRGLRGLLQINAYVGSANIGFRGFRSPRKLFRLPSSDYTRGQWICDTAKHTFSPALLPGWRVCARGHVTRWIVCKTTHRFGHVKPFSTHLECTLSPLFFFFFLKLL